MDMQKVEQHADLVDDLCDQLYRFWWDTLLPHLEEVRGQGPSSHQGLGQENNPYPVRKRTPG